jgi:hypothetical protein
MGICFHEEGGDGAVFVCPKAGLADNSNNKTIAKTKCIDE